MADEQRKQLGWQLVPIFEPPKGSIVTQAFITCCVCGKAVSPNGGPRQNAYCMGCVTDDSPDDAGGR